MQNPLAEHAQLADFLKREQAMVIAMPIDEQGLLHAATLTYAHSQEPFTFLFTTSKDSLKCQLLKTRDHIPAAAVVGTVKDVPFSLQMHGTLRIIPATDVRMEAYFQKYGSGKDKLDPSTVCVAFTPTWARFTDYSKGYERTLLDL